MGKQHELLAVETNLKGQSDRVVTETKKVFGKAAHYFQGQTRRYLPIDDEGQKFADEDVDLNTTVADRLDYTFDMMIKAIDASAQKETTNCVAKADIMIGNDVLISNVPATALLTLESRLKEIRGVIEAAPTLQAGLGWERDDTTENVWKSKPIETVKMKKKTDFKVIVKPTEHHPAHVEQVTEDVLIGKWVTTKLSGEITSTEKHEMLAKCDELFREVKKARARANNTEVQHVEYGKTLIDFILG
jgi:hypothetical protein